MLESDAKEKWCPFTRVYEYGVSINRHDSRRLKTTNCLGSDCAVWIDTHTDGANRSHGRCGLVNVVTAS